MAKKITITLSDKAEKYLNEVLYALTGKDDKPCTQSEAINESLETLAEFERLTDNQLRNWLGDFIQLPPDRKSIIADPTEINVNKFF